MPQKVSMTLTEQDVQNAEWLTEVLHLPNKAETVGTALEIVTALSKVVGKGDELILKHRNGFIQALTLAGINDD